MLSLDGERLIAYDLGQFNLLLEIDFELVRAREEITSLEDLVNLHTRRYAVLEGVVDAYKVSLALHATTIDQITSHLEARAKQERRTRIFRGTTGVLVAVAIGVIALQVLR